MKPKLIFLGLILLALVTWSAGSRAQQNPSTNSTNLSAPPAETAASASVSGTISDAKSGTPLRRASVTLRQSNAGRGGQGNRGGQGPGANNGQIQDQIQALLNGGLPNQINAGGGPAGQGGNAAQGGGRGGQQGQGGGQFGQGGAAGGAQGGGRNQVTTGDDGTYSFPNVNPGQYQVIVERDGFITQ